jgi:ubiquinone/menaquinone biosynthesis C-methylase UbiE
MLHLRYRFSALLRLLLGRGWAYRFPGYYQRVIGRRFGAVREQAFRHFLAKAGPDLQGTALDLACGTGLTTLWLASACPGLRLTGVDADRGMLASARRQARKLGVADRCTFLEADARTLAALPEGPADLVTCSLGYSVFDDWEATFGNTLRLLKDDGWYVIFDQHEPGLVLPDFAADQSRRPFELVERSFLESETTWFGSMFLAVGRRKRAATPKQAR